MPKALNKRRGKLRNNVMGKASQEKSGQDYINIAPNSQAKTQSSELRIHPSGLFLRLARSRLVHQLLPKIFDWVFAFYSAIGRFERAELIAQRQPYRAFAGLGAELAGLLIQPIKTHTNRRCLLQTAGWQLLHKISPDLQCTAGTT